MRKHLAAVKKQAARGAYFTAPPPPAPPYLICIQSTPCLMCRYNIKSMQNPLTQCCISCLIFCVDVSGVVFWFVHQRKTALTVGIRLEPGSYLRPTSYMWSGCSVSHSTMLRRYKLPPQLRWRNVSDGAAESQHISAHKGDFFFNKTPSLTGLLDLFITYSLRSLNSGGNQRHGDQQRQMTLQSRGHQAVTALSSPASSPGDPPYPHPHPHPPS